MTRKKKPNGYWTKERCAESAKPYATRIEWRGAERSAYQAAQRKGWLDECCAHMSRVQKPRGYWAKERCIASAKSYATRYEWCKAEPSAYHTAHRNGWLEECCAHMEPAKKPKGYWTPQRCMESAKPYSTRGEWRKAEGGSYDAAFKYGWIDDCCAHMERLKNPKGHWTKERCLKSAANYSSAPEWHVMDGGAYSAAYRNGWIEECCAHMEGGGNGDFDAVYVWEIIDALGPTSVYKVGLTSWKLGETRIKQVAGQGVDYRLLGLCRTSKGDARIFEDFILCLGNPFTDVPDTFDGRTELRTFSPEAIGTIHHLLGVKEESLKATP